MNNLTKEQRVIELLQEMNDCELVYLHNEYCQKTKSYDYEIYPMDMFDELMHGLDPYTIACRVAYGEFNGSDEYFRFNGYGNIQTIHKWDIDRYVDYVDIARYIVENDDDFDINGILCILSDDQEEEENE